MCHTPYTKSHWILNSNSKLKGKNSKEKHLMMNTWWSMDEFSLVREKKIDDFVDVIILYRFTNVQPIIWYPFWIITTANNNKNKKVLKHSFFRLCDHHWCWRFSFWYFEWMMTNEEFGEHKRIWKGTFQWFVICNVLDMAPAPFRSWIKLFFFKRGLIVKIFPMIDALHPLVTLINLDICWMLKICQKWIHMANVVNHLKSHSIYLARSKLDDEHSNGMRGNGKKQLNRLWFRLIFHFCICC